MNGIANECQVGMKWRIKEDYLKKNVRICSEKFTASSIPGVKYFLSLNWDEYNHDELKICLNLEFKFTKRIQASIDIYVKAFHEKHFPGDYCYHNSGGGWTRTIDTRNYIFNPQERYFVDGIVEIEFDGTLESHGIKRKASQSCKTLGNAYWKRNDKDLTMIVEKQRLKIHKWVICDKSSVFKAEMESGLKESVENVINITDFSFEIVKMALMFCYEQNITESFIKENASELIRFADKYDIKSSHEYIQHVLIKTLSEVNVVEFANISITYNAEELCEYCICFLTNAIKKKIIINDAKKISAEITNEICQRSILSTSN
uniref:BTB domain-containing protein n=1 Tax=Panagrolaimus sp. PS1159 TaxID=55785 RepID=A0AC35FA86_9BILA